MPSFLTREFFDTLIIVIVLIGAALAAVRIYQDFTRPLPPSRSFPPVPPADVSATGTGEDPTPTPTPTPTPSDRRSS